MSTGSALIGIAVTLVVAAYLARPFRTAGSLNRAIETWVAQVRAEQENEEMEKRREVL